MAVAVPELLILRAFVTAVLVAVTEKLPVTVRFAQVKLPNVLNPFVEIKLPLIVASPFTTRPTVVVVDATFRSPWTLL